ncbi:hypothetical protein RD792_006152, partial [Penstemon davidsonii]
LRGALLAARSRPSPAPPRAPPPLEMTPAAQPHPVPSPAISIGDGLSLTNRTGVVKRTTGLLKVSVKLCIDGWTFPIRGLNWLSNFENEQKNFSDFSFQAQTEKVEQNWDHQESDKQDGVESEKSYLKSELNSLQTFSPEISTIQTNDQSNKSNQSEYNQYNKASQNKKSDDGYNWRKYGQKQVKGSENP